MKKGKRIYDKKELYLFLNSIDIYSTKRGEKYLKLQEKWPEHKESHYNLEKIVQEMISNNNAKSKFDILFFLSGGGETRSRMDELNRLLELYNLNKVNEMRINKLQRTRRSNAFYINELSHKKNKKLNNLSKNKIKQLENDIYDFLVDKINKEDNNPFTAERLAFDFNVKLKYVYNIFQDLMREGRIRKSSGKSDYFYRKGAYHSTFYYTNRTMFFK